MQVGVEGVRISMLGLGFRALGFRFLVRASGFRV